MPRRKAERAASTSSARSPRKDRHYCCLVTQYYSKHSNLTESLSIIPRVIKHGGLRLNQVYQQRISITNTGLYPRHLMYSTNCPKDTQIKVYGTVRYRYINAGQNINVEITIRPKSKEDLTIDRHIYIESEHPNIIFDIPLIYVPKKSREEDLRTTLPTEIVFPRSLTHSKCYYELVLYNPQNAPAAVVFKTASRHLEGRVDPAKAPPRDFSKILLTLHTQNMTATKDIFKVKFGTSTYRTVHFSHVPIMTSLYLSTNYLPFEETKYERETRKDFLICNECDRPVRYELQFLTETCQLVSITENYTDSVFFDVISSGKLKSQASQGSSMMENLRFIREEAYCNNAYRHFRFSQAKGVIAPFSSEKLSVFFQPVMDPVCDFDDDLNPPFLAMSKFFLTTPDDEMFEARHVALSGLIAGVEVHLVPKIIDFRRIYLGEEHCEQIFITNADGIVNSEVFLKWYGDPQTGTVLVQPEEAVVIEPCERKIFKLLYYARALGRIAQKVVFKVRNGPHLNVILKASVQAVKVKTYPDCIEFGTVPIAVPQKRSMLIMNPLSVPISVKLQLLEDGSEAPLILNVENIGELPPITTRNPYDDLLEARRELYGSQHDSEENIDIIITSECPLKSYRSFEESENTSVSTRFENEVLDPISEIADCLIYHVKNRRFAEKPDAELNIITEATYSLLEIPYFERLIKYTNYAFADWNGLPSDPREIFIGSEVIHLKPNTVKNVTVLLIPNTVGLSNRIIEYRCLPHAEFLDEDDPMRAIVDTQLMVSRMNVIYHCRIPQINWNREVKLNRSTGFYVYQKYDFEMVFENEDDISGFFHYAIVPDSDNAKMDFTHNAWKFFIRSNQIIQVACSITFKKVGDIIAPGLVKVVGNPNGETFFVWAHVLPTKIRFSPSSLYHRKKVLEKSWAYIFIENITPTSTFFTLKLKYETKYYYLVPRGARLAPTGQGMYVAIHTMFPDPDVYKNVLYIDMQFGEIKEIPLTFNVVGVPIFFDPDLRNGLNAGVMLANCQRNLEGGYTQYSRVIRTWNRGERRYVITFQKLRNSREHCSVEGAKGSLVLSPKIIELAPGEEKEIHITAIACDETQVYNEFRVDITDVISKKRMETIRFEVTATFMDAQLRWSRKEVCMDYYRTHPFKEFPHIEIVKLINETCLPIDIVYLKVAQGPFKIKELFEDQFQQEVAFCMDPKERKELTITLDKDMLSEDSFCTKLRGRVICYANAKPQRTLLLCVNVTYPRVKISQPEMVVFTSAVESDAVVELRNISPVEAQFKWRKVSEEFKYLSEIDDEMAYVQDLLSDILCMLEIADTEHETDPLCVENLQKCHEKYHCYLRRLEDPIGIRDMVYEIIEDIDYEHKRYQLTLSESDDEENFNGDSKSSVVAAKSTLYQILNKLKLEDSFEVSEPSTEACDKQRTVYFYEKAGRIHSCENFQSLIHLPSVKKDYMVKAVFILDVVGGEPQELQIIAVNRKKVLEISSQSIYLGPRPWYELFKTKASIENITEFTINAKLEKTPLGVSKGHKLANGYVRILNDRNFDIPKFSKVFLRMEGTMGFNDVFIRHIKLTINDRETKNITLRGQGIMPTLKVTGNLQRQEQDAIEIEDDYRTLQRVYYFETFKAFQEYDESEHMGEEESMEDDKLKTQRSRVSSSTYSTDFSDGMLEAEEEEEEAHIIFPKGFVVVDHRDVPNAMVLEQSLETEKFLETLRVNPCVSQLLQSIHGDYLRFVVSYDEKLPMNLKYFTVQPLPFEQLGYVYRMNGLKMDQFRKYEFNVHFFGPGALIASARTAVKVPGLFVDFRVLQEPSEKIEFLYYSAEHKSPDFFKKRYRNMHERIRDLETDPRIKQPHAFDCRNFHCGLHRRDIKTITAQERRDILNYYSSLNKSIHSDHKHHFVLCKIFGKSRYNFSDIDMRVTLFMKPSSEFYQHGQVLEDFLYIDLHMGPTLPILLRGVID